MLLTLLLACKPAIVTDDSAPTTDDSTAPTDDSSDPGEWAQLYINEFMASNESTVQDEGGAYPDWIELYNPNGEAVDLAGWTLTDDLAEPDKHTLEDLSVPAGGWLLLFADDDEEEGPNHVGFNLGRAGEQIGLYSPTGVAIDEISYGEQTTDMSAARTTDGGNEWEITDSPTPGASNGG
ncbi:MAG: lamin tail domain-containing protein [Alphaproteobacteria bacterium]|nr:lamin tail domain-containing protein [Alphaproteobacteria bacterium]